jgi:hypothetical protein
MRGTRHVWARGEVHTGFWWRNNSLGRPRRRRDDNVKMNLKRLEGRERERSRSGKGQVAGSCKRGNEPPASIKCG